MVNLTAPAHPAFRAFATTVVSNTQLSPSFRRLVFTGPLLHHFADSGLDQRVKLIVPSQAGQRLADLGQHDLHATGPFEWRDRWRSLPDPSALAIRTYTVGEIDRENRLLTIDFVVHPGGSGPGSDFARTATPTREAIIAGPDARSDELPMGIDYKPGTAQEVVLVADETALPAVRSILRQTPAGNVRLRAFVELASIADAIDLRAHGHELNLVLRGKKRGENLIRAVNNWCQANPNALRLGEQQELTEVDVDRELLWETATDTGGGFYAWLAGEAGMIRDLRRILVKEKGVDRRKVSFMGYWREGQTLSLGG